MKGSEVDHFVSNLQDSDYGSVWHAIGYDDIDFPIEIASGVVITEVLENYGGGEGSGEKRYIVFTVVSEDGTQLFRKNGVYVSYDGDRWDEYGSECFEVVPKVKAVVVYEKAS